MKSRIWIEIVLLGTAIACALALLLATLGTAAGVAGRRVWIGRAAVDGDGAFRRCGGIGNAATARTGHKVGGRR